MTAARRPAALAGAIGVALVILGLGAWGISRLLSGNEPHSYARGDAPYYVHVQAGHHYAIAVRGGVTTETRAGLNPTALRCSASSPNVAPATLALTAEGADTKATNQIGSFVAPVSAAIHVDCIGLGPVFVDDATSAGTDWAGVAVLLAVIALGIGLPLSLSVLRRSLEARHHQQVQGRVESSAEDGVEISG